MESILNQNEFKRNGVLIVPPILDTLEDPLITEIETNEGSRSHVVVARAEA